MAVEIQPHYVADTGNPQLLVENVCEFPQQQSNFLSRNTDSFAAVGILTFKSRIYKKFQKDEQVVLAALKAILTHLIFSIWKR